ncbi:MAG: hypothetical protein PHQ28_03355 [Mycobacterium sp.]|nr:hypothetical protein [Mycobacterium sp.]
MVNTDPSPSVMVAARIKRRRQQRRWSLQDLANRCAMVGGDRLTDNAIENIEHGRRDRAGKRRREVTLEELVIFARVLGFANPWDLTKPAECAVCFDAPPVGFRCLSCGTEAESPKLPANENSPGVGARW